MADFVWGGGGRLAVGGAAHMAEKRALLLSLR